MRTRCETGVVAGPARISRWPIGRGRGVSPVFPPSDQATVRAVACELAHEAGQPLSRQSVADVTYRVRQSLECEISRSTVWRWLDQAALKPWRYRYWLFPRDPDFFAKAARVLDLYAGHWDGEPLSADDFVVSSDEKTSIQARLRFHASLPAAPGRSVCVEHKYRRGGALQYLAAWDVRRGQAFGHCDSTTGIIPFGRLADQVMQQEPYRSARRVFWIVDNGSSHRGEASARRLRDAYSNAILVHTPLHASWLNQVEIYFSIVQRKVLTPNDFTSLAEVEDRLLRFQDLINLAAQPFQWNFTRDQLIDYLARLNSKFSNRPDFQPFALAA